MTIYRGVNGVKNTSKNNGDQPFGINGGYLACFAKDYLAVVTAVADTDKISLGKVRDDAYLDADLSKITFDDMGTSITLDIGCDDVAMADWVSGSSTLLADNIDVATAAGSSSILASVATANKHKPLWQQLGLTSRPYKEIELFATFAGNPGTGNVHWKIIGS